MSNVTHPSHYNSGQIEVIDFIDDQKLGFSLGNAIKYIARAGKKNPEKTVEDLEKAIWYLKHEIDRINCEDTSWDGIKLMAGLSHQDEHQEKY